MTYETLLVWSLSFSFSFLFLILLLLLPPAFVSVPVCVLLLRNFQTKHQTHDTPNYFTCSNFLLFLLRFFALSLPLGECECVCVTTLQSFHSYRFHFHCSMLFAVLFAFLLSCFVRLLCFFLPFALFFARKFLYNCVLSASELYRLQNVFMQFLFGSLCILFLV